MHCCLNLLCTQILVLNQNRESHQMHMSSFPRQFERLSQFHEIAVLKNEVNDESTIKLLKIKCKYQDTFWSRINP